MPKRTKKSQRAAAATRKGRGAARGSVAGVEQSKNLCAWVAATLESALLGARKSEIEWALKKAEIAVRTLKRAKLLMPLNTKSSGSSDESAAT